MVETPLLFDIPRSARPPAHWPYQGKPRPKYSDPLVVAIAAERMCDRLMKWAAANEDEREQYLGDLKEVLEGAAYRDGYELAKAFDRKGYSADSELVDLMESSFFTIRTALAECMACWVVDNNVTPPYPLDAPVRVKHKGAIVEGTIVTIYDKMAECSVYCPSLGHVREGTGTHGIIVQYEQLLPAVAAAE